MSTPTANNGSETPPYRLYQYVPSLAAAVIAIVVFAILTIAHIRHMIKTRAWFCTPIVFGGLFETIGYVGRALSHKDNEARNPFIIQSVLILVAPALFAATIYMALGRLMRTTNGTNYSIIRVTWITKVFVTGDVLSFFVIGGGGGIMAGGDLEKIKTGERIILGGLLLQIIMFGLFIVASIIFHVRMQKNPTQQSYNPRLRWQRTLWILYAASAIIMVRNIVRVVEYIQGYDGALLKVEWPIYVFDALPMATTMAILFLVYPSTIQPKIAGPQNTVELRSDRVP